MHEDLKDESQCRIALLIEVRGMVRLIPGPRQLVKILARKHVVVK